MGEVSRRKLVTLAGSGIVGTAIGLGVATQIRGTGGGRLELRTRSEIPEGTSIVLDVRAPVRNGSTLSHSVDLEGGDERHRLKRFSGFLDRLVSVTATVEMRTKDTAIRPRLKMPVEIARVDE